jgi:hypothetical protein
VAITVTATQGTDTFNGIALAVRVYTGAVEAGGASNTFHVSPGTGPAAVSLTPNATSSLPVFCTSLDTNTAVTAATNNAYDNNSSTPFGVSVGDGHYTGTVTSGTPVTVGSSAPTASDHYNCAAYEIRPSGGSTPALDGSGPAWATTSTAITVTTASFTPPPGSVLVALIESFASGTGSGQTMTVSDTSGLAWTQRAAISFANQSEAVFIFTATVPAGGGAGPARPGKTWLRRFHHRQQQFPAAPVTAAPQAGPPVYPLGHPVRARQLPAAGGRAASRDGTYAQAGPAVRPLPGPVRARVPQPVRGGQADSRQGVFAGAGPALRALASAVAGKLRGLPPRGRAASRAGTYAQAGPPVTPPHGPVQARRLPQRGGTADGRAGTLTSAAPQSGPPVYPLGHPVQARRLPQRGGSTSSRDGTYAGLGPPVKAPDGPVRAQPGPQRGGRTVGRAGTYTAVVTGSGPPVYPLGHPVAARRLPAQGGRVIRRAGTYAQAGPPVKPASGPIGIWRRQPPPPARGRTASLRGVQGVTGPPVRPLGHALRAQPQKPLLTGRTASRAGIATFIPPPPFTVGALTAADTASGVLTAAGASSALTASTAASGTLAGAVAAAGTAAYAPVYGPVYGPQEGTLTATDTRTGGPS